MRSTAVIQYVSVRRAERSVPEGFDCANTDTTGFDCKVNGDASTMQGCSVAPANTKQLSALLIICL